MDMHSSIIAANLASGRQKPVMTERAEAEYYRAHGGIRPPRLRPLAPVAAVAGLVLLLIGIAQA